MAYVVNIVMMQYERGYKVIFKKHIEGPRRAICIILSYLTVVLIIGLVVAVVVPQIISAVELLIKNSYTALSPYLNDLSKYPQINSFLETPMNALKDLSTGSISATTQKVLESIFTGATGVLVSVTGILSSVFSVLSTLLFGFMFSLYLLGGKETLLAQLNRVIKTYLPKGYEKIQYVAHVFNESFRDFVIGQVTEAFIIGILTMLGCTILRFPYAPMVGTIIGMTALIPIVGAYIGAVISAFLIFTVAPIKALEFIIFIFVLQQFEDNVIYPKVVGTSLGLPGIWVLGSITLFGGVFGFIGMLIGVPVTSAFYKMLQNDMRKRNQSPINK